jgi:CRISPR/Cas system Type II protein with McrA/HNH and RuvC-like nuclease domain
MAKAGFLESLTKSQRDDLIRRLWEHQKGTCYISGEPIDLQVHEVDLDHITARSRGGMDDEANIGLALAHHNRSKGVRDLELQRRIFHFYKDLAVRTAI